MIPMQVMSKVTKITYEKDTLSRRGSPESFGYSVQIYARTLSTKSAIRS